MMEPLYAYIFDILTSNVPLFLAVLSVALIVVYRVLSKRIGEEASDNEGKHTILDNDIKDLARATKKEIGALSDRVVNVEKTTAVGEASLCNLKEMVNFMGQHLLSRSESNQNAFLRINEEKEMVTSDVSCGNDIGPSGFVGIEPDRDRGINESGSNI